MKFHSFLAKFLKASTVYIVFRAFRLFSHPPDSFHRSYDCFSDLFDSSVFVVVLSF